MIQVLLVDDEPRSRMAIAESVQWSECGIERVFQASSKKEAMEIIQKETITILICDIEMPDGTGLDLVTWVKQEGYNMGVIFVTCHPEFEYMRKAIQLKCNDYILKPINYEELTVILCEMIRQVNSSSEIKNRTQEDSGIPSEELGNQDPEHETDEAVLQRIQEHLRNREVRDVEQEVKKYIREHLMDDLSVTEIAEAMHFNPQYLMRMFKMKTGTSIIEYTTQTRMNTAKKILRETDLSIKEVSDIVGYKDYGYFTRVFKKETGVSPSAFRNLHEK